MIKAVAFSAVLGILTKVSSTIACSTTNKVLFYEDTYDSYYSDVVESLGYDFDVIGDTEWRLMTSADFAAYNAIVFCDPNSSDLTLLAAAEDTTNTWGSVVNGNVVIIGTDEIDHGGFQLIQNGLEFVLEDTCQQTGLYISLSAYYDGTISPTVVTVLEYFGEFEAYDPGDCYNDVHIVAEHTVLDSLDDDDLSDWSCSIHEAMVTYPNDYVPLAIANDLDVTYTEYFADGSYGLPYILVRGDAVSSISCEQAQNVTCDSDGCRYKYSAIELSTTKGSMLGGDEMYVYGPCIDTVNEWYCRFGGIKTELERVDTSTGKCIVPSSGTSGKTVFGIMQNDDWYSGLLLTLFEYENIFINGNLDGEIQNNSDIFIDPLYNAQIYDIDDKLTITWNINQFSGYKFIDILMFEIVPNIDEIDYTTSYDSNFIQFISKNTPNDGEYFINGFTHLTEYGQYFDETTNDIQEALIIFVLTGNDTVYNNSMFDNTANSLSTRRLSIESFIVYHTNIIGIQLDEQTACEKWAENDEVEYGNTWHTELSDCPDTYPFARTGCELPGWKIDDGCNDSTFLSRLLCDFFHNGASNCIRNTDGQQCCYDSSNNLCISGTCGGTADKVSAEISKIKHFKADVWPYLKCCKFSDECDLYWARRPINQGGGESPACATTSGDPHFMTWDQYTYTFNGLGDYYLAIHPNFEISIALTSISEDKNVCPGSIVTGIGIYDINTTNIYEFSSGDGISGIQIYQNGEELLLPSTNDSDLIYNFGDFEIEYDYTIVKFTLLTLDISLQIWLQEMENIILNNTNLLQYFDYFIELDSKYNNTVQGLMGNFDGKIDNDLITPNGTLYNTTNQDLSLLTLYEFGKTWQMSSENNFFLIISAEIKYGINDTECIPLTEIDFTHCNNYTIEIIAYELCNDDTSCLLDAAATCNIEFANNTYEFQNFIELVIEELNEDYGIIIDDDIIINDDNDYRIVIYVIIGCVMLIGIGIFIKYYCGKNDEQKNTENNSVKTSTNRVKETVELEEV